jgi:hypothetical protein
MSESMNYIEISHRELREIRWRAFLAGYDACNSREPLNVVFEGWCQDEREALLEELRDLTQ